MILAPLTPEQDKAASEEFDKLYPPGLLVNVYECVREATLASLDGDYLPTRPLPVHRARS